MSISIKAENLSKAYQIGQIGTGTISRDIERWWMTKVMRREDPFLKVGEVNDRSIKGSSDIVWSLKDINFEIEQGDAVGIIGKNGAGKSTLLKLLSRVTSPTSGRIKLKGRVASLLEVGTGFHPELTGRENIYLNGSILGMRKKEIDRKFDEIVDFSGVERYIDTPVKRYSSGMYVRLAFAVAAHLESEILIVDEVLAVGDAEFQKKCLGKMKDVSKGEGRTVLFVSHNMSAVKVLCENGILLENGKLGYAGEIESVVSRYANKVESSENTWSISESKDSPIYFEKVIVNVIGKQPSLKLVISSDLRVKTEFKKSFVAFNISSANDTPIMQAIPVEEPFIEYTSPGLISIKTVIDLPPMIPNNYQVSCWIGSHYKYTIDLTKDVVSFEVRDFPKAERTFPYTSNCGFLVPKSKLEVIYSC